MIEKIQKKIYLLKGKNLNFRFVGSRNQTEEFNGMIIETYNHIFIIKCLNSDKIKSFSYNDILTKNLSIDINN